MKLRSKVVTCCICAVCGILSSGCSYLFVTSPPKNAEKLPPSEPVECTTSRAAPVIDTAVTAFEVLRTVYAIRASDGDYSGVPISRGVDIGFGIGLTALFGASMIHGYTTTNECIDAKAAHERRRPAPGASPVTLSTPPTSPAAPAPAPAAPATITPTENHAGPAPAPTEGTEGPATREGAPPLPAE